MDVKGAYLKFETGKLKEEITPAFVRHFLSQSLNLLDISVVGGIDGPAEPYSASDRSMFTDSHRKHRQVS